VFGWVDNRNDGVYLEVSGSRSDLEMFIKNIKVEAPAAANILNISTIQIEDPGFNHFEIVKSKDTSSNITEVSPDIAVCEACLNDMKLQPHRINYPFINCTNCGPRFTIIKDLPYDRHKTTMDPFVMCKQCSEEYMDIHDRRFHAQPVACNNCGPVYKLISGASETNQIDQILETTAELLENGKIIAMKGLGGFHLACDALNEDAVIKLRNSKHREGKPFAVMFRDLDTLKSFCETNSEEEELLTSWRRPILLLEQKREVAPSVSVGFSTIGSMLPYMPFHYLLFEKTKLQVMVLTSGNLSDEPIIIDNNIAVDQLSPISDAIITYNREIHNRSDDSVAMVVNGQTQMIRRSRGYAPSPVRTNLNTEGILAVGAELVNCFCVGKGDQAILSQHIGDLKNLETLEFFTESIDKYRQLFRAEITQIVCDEHPDYLSTKYAMEQNITLIKVQHHHAHIASCMAENGIDEQVIGVAFDGIGLGDDNHIWGGEFLICDLADYERYTHFDYVWMPGGDKASKEPWRMAISYLYKVYGEEFMELELPFLKKIESEKVRMLVRAIQKGINSPMTSSTGRLFDAIAALTDITLYSDFHAEAPMRLESVIDKSCVDAYEFEITGTIKTELMIRKVVDDILTKIPAPVISAKFHNTIINIIFAAAKEIRTKRGLNKVAFSGGTFQNRYLLEKAENLLLKNSFEVFTQNKVPANDGGIALGQLAIAAKKLIVKSEK
jgi:hydrogenase maturation protein HypF